MSSKTAIKILLWLFTAVTIFHFCILIKIIPYEITWGGRLKNDAEMYVFESLSLTINILLIFTLLIKGNYIKRIFSIRLVNIILWAFLVLFGLNTIGNLFATTNFEKLFAVLTLAASVLIWITLKAKEQTTQLKHQ
ncbi:hypothetical protein [Adhaeribacter aquaticus]|uniref:hypothetical protein n=1 Tax=Adhaeribacter aquaticus TaxID=299567 RepID=UPI00047BCF92|nr:hypothetical protein [Adhaeribacter aquaticus]